MPRTIHLACFHIPDFPAVAVQRAERLTSDVVIIQKHVVYSCTRGAHALGVEIGDSSQRAERLAPGARLVLRKYTTELSVWEEVLQAVYTLTPHIVVMNAGSALLHATDAQKLRLFAAQYKARVGIASSKLTARLAAYSCESNALHFISDADAKRFLSNAPVELLQHFQIDDDCLEKLGLFGLNTLSKLSKLSERHLGAQFGKQGKRLYKLVQEIMSDKRATLPYFLPPQPIAAHRKFENNIREPREFLSVLDEMLAQAMAELRKIYGRKCCWIGLRLLPHKSQRLYSRRILKEACDSIDYIRTTAQTLLRSLMNGSECTEMTFELGGLVIATATQISFIAEKIEPRILAEKVEQRYPHTMYKAQITNAEAYLAEDRFTLLPYATE